MSTLGTTSIRTRQLPELRSTASTAQMLGCSTKTIRRLIERGELTPVRLGRHLRFEVTEVERYIERNRVTPE
jgi:excisionase family DNA binding protein